MAFDAEVTVNARERFMRVRNLIAELPPERFNYNEAWADESMRRDGPIPIHECHSNVCILGWARVLYGYVGHEEAFYGLGLDPDTGYDLVFGAGPFNPSRDQAVRTMDHLAATGVVDWTVGS